MRHKIVNFSFIILKVKFLRSSKCLKTKWNSPGQPAELIQKLEKQQHHTHDIHMLSLLLATIMLQFLKVFNAEEFHILKSIKVNCSDNNKLYNPFLWMGLTVSRLQGRYEETVYFLPLSSREFLVLNLSTSEGWMSESTLERSSSFEIGTPWLGIQCLNQYAILRHSSSSSFINPFS